MPEYFLVAKINSVYSKDGFVKITSFSDIPGRFNNLSKVYIDFFGSKKEFFVEKIREVKGSFVIKFQNFNNDKDVEVLLNKEVFVDQDNLAKLPENYFFIHDLVGSRVLKNNAELGSIADVLRLPAHDVYVIVNNDGKEILIPAVEDFIDSFDAENKILYLQPDKLLYEDDED